MHAEPLAVLHQQHLEGDVPGELLETIDFVLSAPRQLYVDGYLVITAAEARAIRER